MKANKTIRLARDTHTRATLTLISMFVLLAVLALSACSKTPNNTGINDPNEVRNRKIHAFNKSLTRVFAKKDANGKVIIQEEEDTGTRPRNPVPILPNFVNNLAMPQRAVNNLLQGRGGELWHTTLRFVINTTIGIGGLADVASALGVRNRAADFGQTLDRWGFGEGRFVTLPFLGPSTQRDATGLVVDIFTDPFRYILSRKHRRARGVLEFANFAQNQASYWTLSKKLLHGSEDSYATVRSFYLQNRRFFINEGLDSADLEDPYADDY